MKARLYTLKRYYKEHDMVDDYYRLKKSFWPTQGNDYFLLKMPDWLIEKIKVSNFSGYYSTQFKYEEETYVPVDAKLKNIILHMWKLGIYTGSMDESPRGHINISKYTRSGKNSLELLKKYIVILDEKNYPIYVDDLKKSYHIFFSDKGLDIFESGFGIEKVDISKALPGYYQVEKYFWPMQNNDYFLLRMPDWLVEKNKAKFVPIDAKLKNIILYMWNLGVYTESVSEPDYPGIGQISIKKNGKNFLDSLKKILNDDIFVTDKKRFNLISAIDGGDKFTLFFTDKGLDILESAFNIEKVDISKALPGYNQAKK